MSAIAERTASTSASLDCGAAVQPVLPDRPREPGNAPEEDLVGSLCALLQDAISARFVVVVRSEDGRVPRLLGAPDSLSSLDCGGPQALDRTCEMFLELIGSTADLSISLDTLDGEPYVAFPIRNESRSLGVLVAADAHVTAKDWPMVARFAAAIGQFLNQELDRRRREERLVAARLALAQTIHDGVVQELFGIQLALDGSLGGTPDELRGHAATIRNALRELRSLLHAATQEALPEDAPAPCLTALSRALRAEAGGTPLKLDLEAIAEVPHEVGTAVVRFIGEGVRNALKHADPTLITVRSSVDRALQVCVENDGARFGDGPCGIGLRLLELDARQLGGFISVAHEEDRWHLTLTMPLT